MKLLDTLLDTVTADLSKVRTVEISYGTDDIKISIVGEGQKLEVREYMEKGAEENYAKVTFNEFEGILKIESGKRDKNFLNLIIGNTIYSRCEVDIPKDYRGKMIIGTASGDIEMNSTGSMGMSLLDLGSVSGDVDLEGYEGPELCCHTVSGDAEVMSTRADKLGCSSVSGDIRVKGMAFNAECSSTSGDVSLEFLNAPSLVNCSTVSGDVRVVMPASAEVQANLSTVSGDRKNDFSQSSSDGASRVNMNTVSGDAALRRG